MDFGKRDRRVYRYTFMLTEVDRPWNLLVWFERDLNNYSRQHRKRRPSLGAKYYFHLLHQCRNETGARQ